MDTDVDGGTVGLLALDALDVDAELFTVALNDLADLLAFVVTANNLDLVVFADGHGPYAVLLTELLGEGGAHQDPPDVGGGGEVALALLATGRGDVLVQLHGGWRGCESNLEDRAKASLRSGIFVGSSIAGRLRNNWMARFFQKKAQTARKLKIFKKRRNFTSLPCYEPSGKGREKCCFCACAQHNQLIANF